MYTFIFKLCVVQLSIQNSHHFEACPGLSLRVLERRETEAERWACSWIATLADFNFVRFFEGFLYEFVL